MDFPGYGGSRGGPPPEDFPPHLQEQNSNMQGWFPDPRSHFHHGPFEQEYPPARGPSFWHHDSQSRPDAPPSAFPPSFPSFFPPQQEFGHHPPPFPPHSNQYPPHFGPHNSFGQNDQNFSRDFSQSSSFGDNSQHSPYYAPHSASSFGETGQYSPHLSHRSSSSREDSQREIHSVAEHRDYYKSSSFEHQGGSPSVSSFDRSSHSYRTPSAEDTTPTTFQRELVLQDEDSPSLDVELPKGQVVRVFCRHSRSFNLAVEGNRVVMMEADVNDDFQHWIRDDRYSIRVRDNSGHPAFMLINKGSKKALKHGPGHFEEVQLTDYHLGLQGDDLFWTESQEFTEGFKTMRKASDTLLNLSVSCGNKIENGCVLILDTWHKTDNQLWKIFPV